MSAWVLSNVQLIPISCLSRLLQATPAGENPADLLLAAARDHIPINPNKPKTQELESSRDVPDPQHRPAIEDVISEIQQQDWYADQISYHRIFEVKVGRNGKHP